MAYFAMEQYYDTLKHFGVKGMKWGVHKLKQRDYNSATTRRVVDDYNSMRNRDFLRKYHVGKGRYAIRYGLAGLTKSDPYKKAMERHNKLVNSSYYKNYVMKPETQKKIRRRANLMVKGLRFMNKYGKYIAPAAGLAAGAIYYNSAKRRAQAANIHNMANRINLSSGNLVTNMVSREPNFNVAQVTNFRRKR